MQFFIYIIVLAAYNLFNDTLQPNLKIFKENIMVYTTMPNIRLSKIIL